MIVYDSTHPLRVICTFTGSVFPKAIRCSAPATIAAIVVKLLVESLHEDGFDAFIAGNIGSNLSTAGYSSFTAVLGFMLVFRNSQAYNRYWEGTNHLKTMTAEWLDACAQLFFLH